MLKKTTIMSLSFLSLLFLTLGVASYWRNFPQQGLWIDHQLKKHSIRLAMVKGNFHAVLVRPLKGPQTSANDREAALGPFFVKTIHLAAVVGSGIGAPFWFWFTLVTLPLIFSFIRGPLRRRKRRRLGQCLYCGYSLYGLTDPRCPECATQFDEKRLPENEVPGSLLADGESRG